MATNYFPAANIQPLQQADPLTSLGKVVALRNALQTQQYQQQMQPLQLQSEQQQVQLQKMNIDSQQGLMQAYIDAKGDPDKTLSLAASPNYKVLPKDMLAFQNQQVEYQKNLQTKDETQLKNMDTQGYNLRQLIDPIVNAPPEEQPALFAQAKQKVLDDPARAIKYGITDPTQIPDYVSPQQIKLYDATLTGHQQAIASAQKVADTQKAIEETATTVAERPAKAWQSQIAGEQEQEYNAARASRPGLSYTQWANEQAAAKESATAAASAAARQPYEIERTRIEAGIHAAIQQQFARDMAGANKTEAALKPYMDTMRNVDSLNAAIDQAQAGNLTAMRGVLGPLTGLAVPAGGGRMSGKLADQMLEQGGVPDRFKGTLKNILTGDQWTDKMASDMRAYADSQAGVATAGANRQIDMTNRLYHTNVQPVPQYQRPQATPSAGPVATPPAGANTRVPGPGGKWYWGNKQTKQTFGEAPPP